MSYEITVCKGRKFVFSTQEIETPWETKFLYELLASKFTREEGYRIVIRELDRARIVDFADLTF